MATERHLPYGITEYHLILVSG